MQSSKMQPMAQRSLVTAPRISARTIINFRTGAAAAEPSTSGRAASEAHGAESLMGAGDKPKKICLFVEPSPFSHVSGMKNRFQSLIKNLRQEGDEVLVVTPDPKPPKEYCGAKVG